MRRTGKLAIASLRMFFRQREAVLWTFLLPLFMITLFGFVRFDGLGHVAVGLVAPAGEEPAAVMRALQAMPTLTVTTGSEQEELDLLRKGERDIVLVLPASLRGESASATAYTNDAKPAEAQIALLLTQRVLDDLAFAGASLPPRVQLERKGVQSRHLTYIDFLVPGILAMSVMQMGIFGVAFSFVSLKKRGILRRLSATPVRPREFITAQVMMRLLVVLLQVGVMVGAGLLFFHLHFEGSLLSMFILALLGAVIFLSVGFALAGIAKGEDQVAPLANLITLPMVLLSGVFFSRANLPGIIHTITGWFPLTFLADGMRSVAIDGASLGEVWPQVLGLAIWSLAAGTVAVRFFRWE